MQHEWLPDEHAPCWTLTAEERTLLANKMGATRVAFALLLKAFQLVGRFPEQRDDIAENVVAYVAAQVGVSLDIQDCRLLRRHRFSVPTCHLHQQFSLALDAHR
jgi:hypothetical protein